MGMFDGLLGGKDEDKEEMQENIDKIREKVQEGRDAIEPEEGEGAPSPPVRPADVAKTSVDNLVAAGLTGGVAERVRESARELPVVDIDWGGFPETIARGEREMHEVTVETTAGDARAGLIVTVNGVEMTAKNTYLGKTTLPVGVFGGDADELEFAVRVAFPDLPLAPTVRSRTVGVVP